MCRCGKLGTISYKKTKNPAAASEELGKKDTVLGTNQGLLLIWVPGLLNQ